MAESASASTHPWEDLEAIIRAGNAEAVAMFLQLLPPEDTAYTINQLDPEDQTRMLVMLSEERPGFAADLMEHFADEHAADLIEELEPHHAAAIVEEMDSDEQADVLAEMAEDDLEAILQKMDPEEAEDTRERLEYPHDTAGGLMITEILAYPQSRAVGEVLDDLREISETLNDHEIRYLYATDEQDRLLGVIPMRRIPFAPRSKTLRDVMMAQPVSVRTDESLDDLEDLFDRVDFSAVPVVDHEGELCGVVQRSAVQEALSERSTGDFLKFGGIIGGEEIRSMPLINRWLRRMMFLGPSLVLSTAAVSIIAIFQDVVDQVTAIAIFLPLVANLSGAAGNQAVAVSIRELTLGLVMPRDVWRVIRKEMWIGALNGLAIGAVIGAIVVATDRIFGMEGPVYLLAGIVTIAYVLSSVFAVCIGGSLPLLLRRMKVDPAMVSSPVLTTLTDTISFFLTLSFVALFLLTARA